ncbi:MAG TPA: hypothetical protein VHL34_22385 [Rhizomicrobium sp.]|nr:hypothetical protein [Rhizomicrobium sp.]
MRSLSAKAVSLFGEGKALISVQAIATPVRNVFEAWRRNLPPDWWVSPAVAFCALVYVALFKILLTGFA